MAAAIGSCTIDNHVSQTSPLVTQTQWGTFTCTVTLGGGTTD
jgi:hypothetical protein